MTRRVQRRSALFAGFTMLLVGAAVPTVGAAVPGGESQRSDSVAADAIPILGLDEVRVGMRGVGYTVVAGREPEPFDAEILGVLENTFPKQDLIVARLQGLGLERSGVVAGMSGSPVFIDGRLVGAVAYRLINAGHEAIAGLIPIESMLGVAELGGDRPEQPTAVLESAPDLLQAAVRLLTGGGLPDELRSSLGTPPGVRAIATPVAMSGLAPAVLGRLQPLFDVLGWEVTAGGLSGSRTGVEPYLEPGGIIGVQLVRGDLAVTASGTVTWRDGDRLLAFGHPFLQGGSVDYPLVGAEVITVLSSRQASSKLTTHGAEIIGAIRQDRLPAILGVLNVAPRLVPVTATIRRPARPAEPLDFEIVSDRTLTPLYLFFGLVNAIQSLDHVSNQDAVRVAGSIELADGLEPVRLDNVYSSQNQAIVSLGATLAGTFAYLYGNDLAAVDIERVDLDITLLPDRRTATLTGIWTDRETVGPGDEVVVNVELRPYRQPSFVEQLRFVVPDESPPGRLRIQVGDAGSADQADPEMIGVGVRPTDAAHAVRLLNRARRNDRVYLQVSRAAAGAVLAGRPFPALPPSRLAILESPRSSADLQRLDRLLVLEESRAVDFAVSGSRRVEITVRAR